MKSFIRELVRVVGTFFPMLIFCFALSSQLMRDVSKKPFAAKESKEIAIKKTDTLICLSKQEVRSLHLMFEQFTR